MRRRIFIAWAGLATLMPAARAGTTRARSRFRSNGNDVRVDWTLPGGDHRAAVLLLHGRGGIGLYGADLQRRAALLADRGFAAGTVHYFDASRSSDSPEVTGALFEIWRQALADALRFARSMAPLDPRRIGVIGISLGGFIAGVQAAQDDRIAALVSESSGISTWFPKSPRRMPPLLSVHSRNDELVPLADDEKLNAVAERFGAKPEMLVLEGKEHLLAGASAERARLEQAAFLQRVLQP